MTSLLSPERWDRVIAIFERATELPVDTRAAFLDAECAGDASLRQEVETLLAADADALSDDEIGQALADAATGLSDAAPPVERIGAYRLLSEIGSGGMGSVYRAVRDDDFHQEVAIKIVRGLLGADGLRRFRVERQILASLEHPNIARLLDGGTTGEGLPYLVMELVDGVPLDVYCDTHQLGVRARLELFCTVCDAVSAAHRSLVVHRDLKPSNILVTAVGVPKLLDFGIAKLLTDDDAEMALQTTPSMRVLTPEYASPEQIRHEVITTSSDVYSLGALLYELLSGTRPHVFETRRADEIARIISTRDPRPPSYAATVRSRGRELAGDLDTIVLTALHKEPAQRYSSVHHLAEDLRRYLEGRPVLARPSTLGYRAARFVRRHRAAVATAAVVTILVVGFTIALAQFAARAARERNSAESIATMLVQMFSGSDPRTVRGDTITARELLDQGVERIRRDLRDRPDLQARLLDSVGAIYAGLGLTERAQGVFQQSVTLHESAGAMDSQPAARTMWRLAETLRDKGQLAAAEQIARSAYEMTKRLVGPSNPQVAETLNTLGTIVYARGRREEAESMFLEATQIFRETLGPEHVMVSTGLTNTAKSRRDRGDVVEAERMAREALAIRRRVFGQATAEALSLIASIRIKDGDLDQAEALLREAVAARRASSGNRPHPGLVQGLTELADLLDQRGQGAEAARLREEAAGLTRQLE